MNHPLGCLSTNHHLIASGRVWHSPERTKKTSIRKARRASISEFGTAVIEAVVTTGRRGAHLLTQAEERTTKMFSYLFRYLHAWRRYGITARELSSLGDRELADIGITRSDIRRVSWETQQLHLTSQ